MCGIHHNRSVLRFPSDKDREGGRAPSNGGMQDILGIRDDRERDLKMISKNFDFLVIISGSNGQDLNLAPGLGIGVNQGE